MWTLVCLKGRSILDQPPPYPKYTLGFRPEYSRVKKAKSPNLSRGGIGNYDIQNEYRRNSTEHSAVRVELYRCAGVGVGNEAYV